jgi:integrase
VKLDTRTVAGLSLPPDKTDVIVFDSAMTGFGIRLRKATNGQLRKQWIVQYRHAGASRRLLLGSAEVLKPEQARGLAKAELAKVALGADPQAAKADRRNQDRHTFRAVAADYLAAKKSKLRPRTYVEAERYLTDGRYFGPLHSMPIDKIALRDAAARVTAIERECGLTTALRAKSHGRAMYTWARKAGRVETNPFNGATDLKEPKPRERVLDDAELAAIWKACGDDDFGRIVKLLILTGARRSEIGGLKWSELNYGIWKLPRERSKNDREHVLPLPPAAMTIIESVRHKNNRDQLFGHTAAAGFGQLDYAKGALDGRLGDQVKPWTLHDLRRTTATKMCDLGIAPHIVETILNHQSGHRGGVAGIYNKSRYEHEVREALIRWADHVSALVS